MGMAPGHSMRVRTSAGVARGRSAVVILTTVTTLVLSLTAASASSAATQPDAPDRTPVRSCDSLASLSLADTTVDGAVVHEDDGATPRSCRVHLSITHPPADDDVNVWVWLPVEAWNGRFQGVGGGGFSAGSPSALAEPLRNGYAAAATDGGHPGGSADFVLDPGGTLNWQRIRDFGYLAIHDMTVAAKAVVRAYYGTPPQYSYFTGCSTGGRQALAEAQRYPTDYDGILAGAPVVNWAKMQVAQIWGQVVMRESNNFVPACKFRVATEAVIQACDTVGDGVKDGVIGNPTRCNFDPAKLIGTSTSCGTITETDAEVIRKIWEGPRGRDGEFLWYGLAHGASLAGLNATEVVDGELVGKPFPHSVDWIRYWLLQNPDWDWTTLTYSGFEQLFDRSVEMYSNIVGTSNPDLRAFRDAGGKLIMWHGFSDFGVFPQGTINYYKRVQDVIGNRAQTQKFLRLFMAPGVDHCGGGPGPQPTDLSEALVKWVEDGKAPRTIPAVRKDADGKVTQSRPLCPWPETARYKGHGDPDDASNFLCKKEWTGPPPPDRHTRVPQSRQTG